MAVIVMPTRTDVPHYTFEIDLERRTFRFDFRWNNRDGAWYFGLADVNGVPLLSGRKIVIGIPLLSRFNDQRLPSGEIVAADTTNTDTEAGLADLGERVQLLYFDRADIPDAFRG